jgi:hypothetical protein
MIKRLGLALAVTLAVAGAARANDDAKASLRLAESPLNTERTDLRAAIEKVRDGDFEGARALLGAVVGSPTFAELSGDERYAAHEMFGYTLLQAKDNGAALDEMKAATAFAGAVGEDWMMRLQAALYQRDLADALQSVATIAGRWPTTLSQLNSEMLAQLAFETRNRKDLVTPRVNMLRALYDAHWAPPGAATLADSIWFDLSLALLEQGAANKARAVAEGVVGATTIADMSIDRRFDPITSAEPDRYDVVQAAAREIVILRAAAEAKPTSLEAVNALAIGLIQAGRPGEALAIVDAAIARSNSANGDKPAFADADKLNWTYDTRSEAMILLGRGEEALAAMKAGAHHAEHGALNVSQALNLAELEAHLGHPRDALDAMSDVTPDRVSDYGRADREGILVLVYGELHDRAKMKASLDYIRAHASEAPNWMIRSLLDADDMDGAAAAVIAMLDDAQLRIVALGALQDYVLPDTVPNYVKRVGRKVDALRNRPDVAAAINKVGRIERLPLIPGSL